MFIRGSLDSELARAYSFLRYDEGLRVLSLLSVVLLHRDRAAAQAGWVVDELITSHFDGETGRTSRKLRPFLFLDALWISTF